MPQFSIEQHCRDVIRACMNIVEKKGDTYVALHKDDDVECVVLVSMLRTYPIMSVIVADKILFSKQHESTMYETANALNAESLTGWHTILPDSGARSIYMYRQCLWMTALLTHDMLLDVLRDCIEEYKNGKAKILAGTAAPPPVA